MPLTRRSTSRLRPDLAAVLDRHERTHDHRRRDAVARRHDAGRRTARENVADLLDEGSFVEYGPLVVAAHTQRRSLEELIERTPADGLVGGWAPWTVSSWRCRTTTRSSPAPRGSSVTRRRTGCSRSPSDNACRRVLHRRRGGRPGDTDGLGVSASTASRSTSSPAERVRCGCRDRVGVTASPGTQPSSGAATSSSASRARTSRWAVPR